MKKLTILGLIILNLTSCQTYKTYSIEGYQNVFMKRSATLTECPNSQGTAIDVYLDKDGSGDYSSGDKYESSMYSCNGLEAEHSVTKYMMSDTTFCVEVVQGKLWANKLIANSSAVRLYNGAMCSGSLVNTLNEGSDEVYFNETPNMFIFLEGKNANNKLMLVVVEL